MAFQGPRGIPANFPFIQFWDILEIGELIEYLMAFHWLILHIQESARDLNLDP